MATCRDIVTGGLRLLGVYGGGEDPSSDDAETGLIALQSMYDAWVNSGMFGTLNDVYTATNYTAKELDRVIGAIGVVVTIPPTITDCGTVRAPRDLALIEVSAPTRAVWLYDRTGWIQIDALTADSTAPLSLRGQRGLMACLAIDAAGDFNMPITPTVARLASQFRAMISLHLGSTKDRAPLEYY